MSNDFQGKTALVTGAGSGIGRATALAFAQAGADLVVCDIHEANVMEVARIAEEMGRQVLARRVDVADREAMRAFAKEVHDERSAVDVLVNNAGVAVTGGMLDTPLEDWDWVLSINLMGVIHGCHFFVPSMVRRGAGGHIVNVSSAAGFFGTQELCAYSTTKFGVFGLSEALREELKPHNISVTTICPGVVDTSIVKTGRFNGPWADPEWRARTEAAYKERMYGPEKVAEIIVKAAKKGRSVVPVTPEAWGLYFLKRMNPDLARRIFRAAFERMQKGK